VNALETRTIPDKRTGPIPLKSGLLASLGKPDFGVAQW